MKTKIEWCDYTINPVKGLCPVACSYCYARRMYKRFKWNPEIRYDKTVFQHLPSKPSRIFVGSTMELFGEWDKWIDVILNECEQYPQHTFIFLTKQPQNLIKWSPFLDNCWVGVSVCDDSMFANAVNYLEDIQAKVKFISAEPLMEHLLDLNYGLYYAGINWVIIGQQTPVSVNTQPEIEWIQDIVEAADKAKVRVFLKNNLKPLLCSKFKGNDVVESHNIWAFKHFKLRQEFPC